MTSIAENDFQLDSEGVWVSSERRQFDYSDGIESEAYLSQVLGNARELGSNSIELERAIKDWPSEYHLTRARSQLLKAFDWKRNLRVLEVGCGCGAITRFLGETFDEVVAVEGSHPRAALARKRARDLPNVTIINSPFEDVRFQAKFDIVFCIGVFEYSKSFIEGSDPYERALRHFRDLLTPDGVLVLAIENKFGLKYFSSSAEDHSGVMFDGIEGYPRFQSGASTFGHTELKEKLGEFFPDLQFYFPCPDYKLPTCIVSEGMLDEVNAAELIGSTRSRDYSLPDRQPLFNEQLAWFEICKNRMVPQFANSFLVLAGRSPILSISADWLGVSFSHRRLPAFSTETRFVRRPEGGVHVIKRRTDGTPLATEGKLEHRSWTGEWIDGESLQCSTERLCRSRSLSLEEIFEPGRVWLEALTRASSSTGNADTVPGSYLDSIWRNCFVQEEACRFIDEEWSWKETLPLKLVVMRGLFYFFRSQIQAPGLGPALRGRRIGSLISAVGRSYGLRFSVLDFWLLVKFESEFLHRQAIRARPTLNRRRFELYRMLRKRIDHQGSILPRLHKFLRGAAGRLRRLSTSRR